MELAKVSTLLCEFASVSSQKSVHSYTNDATSSGLGKNVGDTVGGPVGKTVGNATGGSLQKPRLCEIHD